MPIAKTQDNVNINSIKKIKRKHRPHPKNASILEMEQINETQGITLSCTPGNYVEYTKWRLKYLHYLQNIYAQKNIARLKMEKYMRVEQVLHQYSKQIAPPNELTLIAYGDTKESTNSPMKGYSRTPKARLLQLLKTNKNCTVIMQDEFRTTKLCCNCNEVMTISKSPNRYAFCPNCHTVANRDVNAAFFKYRII